jgi:kynurenine formamidase
VLVRTGWSERWPDEKLYRNIDAKGSMRFPGVSMAASRYLRERSVKCLGIDTLSTDPGLSKTFDQHKHFLAGGGYHLENLTGLQALPENGALIVVGALPIRDGSGAPARVLGLIPR